MTGVKRDYALPWFCHGGSPVALEGEECARQSQLDYLTALVSVRPVTHDENDNCCTSLDSKQKLNGGIIAL